MSEANSRYGFRGNYIINLSIFGTLCEHFVRTATHVWTATSMDGWEEVQPIEEDDEKENVHQTDGMGLTRRRWRETSE